MSTGHEYALIRSRRKTLAIHITGNATVEVRAPLKMPRKDIDRFVASKEKWITTHLDMRVNNLAEKSAFSLSYGDKLTLCGKEYPILPKDGSHAGFSGENFYMPPDLQQEQIKPMIVQLFKLIARQFLKPKVAKYASAMGVTPTAVRINSANTRWGSCSGRNSLNFSWKLMMADEDVIDYVVVHELAHIREHNHSPRFWAEVAEVMPDYSARKLELKVLQEKLAKEDWD